MYEQFIKFEGQSKGPTSVVLAGVHGNERCGVEAFQEILPTLSIDSGTVWFGYGNPRAIEQNVRYTEANLNRMFKEDLTEKDKLSYEYKRAQLIKKYLDQASALLDVHASYTPKSRSFLICELVAKPIIKYLPFSLVTTGFDAVEPGGTDSYMNKRGKIGICVECGYLGNKQSTERAIESIFAFLKAQKHINTAERKIYKQDFINMYECYITKSNNFRLALQFADFDILRKGQLIGTDGRDKIITQKDSLILFAKNCDAVGEEAFLLGEKKSGFA